MATTADDDPGYRLRELGAGDVAAVQRFFEANPEYFLTVNGEGPRPDEAQAEFSDLPPAEMAYRAMWLLGFEDGAGALIGVATIVGDFIAAQVWHIGLFIVASSLHGSGVADALYRRLERWMAQQGARWVRLGVVQAPRPSASGGAAATYRCASADRSRWARRPTSCA
jgi:GNAT superfamily N-acetyltransferase